MDSEGKNIKIPDCPENILDDLFNINFEAEHLINLGDKSFETFKRCLGNEKPKQYRNNRKRKATEQEKTNKIAKIEEIPVQKQKEVPYLENISIKIDKVGGKQVVVLNQGEGDKQQQVCLETTFIPTLLKNLLDLAVIAYRSNVVDTVMNQ